MANPLTRLLIRYASAARHAHGNTAAGAGAARLASRLSPLDSNVVRELAERDREAGRVAEAEARLRKALDAQPLDKELRAALGAHLSRVGRLGEAIEILEMLVANNGEDLDTRLELATALASAGKHGAAQAHLLLVLDKQPANRELRGFHAYLLHQLKRDAEARAEFDKAFDGAVPSDRCFAWRALFLLNRGEKNGAAETLRAGLAAHPRSTRLLGDYARFLSEQGGVKEAEELLRKSLTVNPADPLALATLGSLLSRGESTEGDVYFRYALSIDPGHEAALAGLFKVLEKEQRGDEVLTFARGAIAHPLTAGRVLCLCAGRLAGAGAVDEARQALLTAAQRDPNDPIVALTLGELILGSGGDVKEADRWFARALEHAVDEAGVLARVAGARLRMGRTEEAEVLSERALTMDGNCAAALSVRSGVLASRGKYEEALAIRKQTLQLEPENAGAHLDASDLMARLGRIEDARIELQIASRLNPGGNLLLDYSTALLSQGRADHGVALLEEHVKSGLGGARGRFIFAHLLSAVGRRDDARAHLAVALEGAERQQLDSPALREARGRMGDREFAKMAGLGA